MSSTSFFDLHSDIEQLQAALQVQARVLVTVLRVQGSVPRGPGTWMAVGDSAASPPLIATIGGGQLEFEAIAQARRLLHGGRFSSAVITEHALGPSLGQCCGGVVALRYEWLDANDVAGLPQRLRAAESAKMPVALFGGGHVGQALARVLARLPVSLHWIDSRDEVFPSGVPAHILAEHSEPVQAAVQDLTPGSRVLIMSFSHAEDMEILRACLTRRRERCDLPFIGLIGSKSKWASFRARLRERGFSEAELDAVNCPIGLPGIEGKQPEVIALAVAAQLLSQQQG
ncbi:xanthine dehydrogenase accessory protein XdhC [Paucibacter sp. AS339]|uniref:xanthine dehydrogenase accessory protein XdhC n=1 Tax=Paucibacter hankyongi TaxID=3133434 RepID=UPI0030B5ED51